MSRHITKTEGEGFEPSSEENPLKRFSRPLRARGRRGRIWLRCADLARRQSPSRGRGNGWGNEIVVKNLTAVDGRGRTDARGVRRTRHLLVTWTALSNTRRAQKPRLPGSRVTVLAACSSPEK